MMRYEGWTGFTGGEWQDSINVRDFIQKNYAPYTGDDRFLTGATARTQAVNEEFRALLAEERAAGGVLDIDTHTVSTVTAYPPGYIDRERDIIVGLQTARPLCRGNQPLRRDAHGASGVRGLRPHGGR